MSYLLNKGRRSGKTMQLVKTIAEEQGNVLVVATEEQKKKIEMLAERPGCDLSHVTFSEEIPRSSVKTRIWTYEEKD